MRITSITAQKRKRDRFNIFLDGKFSFALDSDVLVAHCLKKDQQLSEVDVVKLLRDGELAKWKNQLLVLLSRRPRSKKELTDYLKRKEVGADTARIVIEDLEEKKLVDDYAFAEWFVEQRKLFRAKGSSFIKSELRQKGIPVEIITEVVTQMVTPNDEVSSAFEFVRKKLKHKTLTPQEFKQKISQWLSQRGYRWDTISHVLEKLKSED